MPRPNPFSRKPNDDQSPETMMFPTDDTQMMDEPRTGKCRRCRFDDYHASGR